ncbi:MAG TPA: hypothetical protein VHZ76_00165 [Gammaproteobacteria bacterium]|jgi:zinc transporter ZupT|nr:hypothetical protein [Gammaproteobacteria bacterium]
MKQLKKLKKIVIWVATFIGIYPGLVYSDRNPFPSIHVDGGNFEQTVGTHLQIALKYALVGVGGLLILICLGVLINRLREDSRDKDHGNLIMTFILLAIGVTVGFILIGVGWTAFSADIQ